MKKNTIIIFSLIILLVGICFTNTLTIYGSTNKKVKVSLKTSTYIYTGKSIKPIVTVKYGNKKLPSKNYKVIYSKGRKNVGKYTIKVKLKGKYKSKTLKGTKKLSFTITPNVPNYELLNDNGTIKVSILKNRQVTGYKIYYKKNTDNSSVKTLFTKSHIKAINELEENVQYIFKVRAYKIVKGKKIWSDWSEKKYITKSGNTINVIDENHNNDDSQKNKEDEETNIDSNQNTIATSGVTQYSYELIPIISSFNTYFYIKTDNPDPDTFRFIDKNTQYAKSGGLIVAVDDIFADVRYEDINTGRVHGGYIGFSGSVDGGSIILQERKKVIIKVNDDPNDPYNRIWSYEYVDTDIVIELPMIQDPNDYVINAYKKDDLSLFENLSEIQNGIYDYCYYSGHYVNGTIQKNSAYNFCGLSCAPYKELDLCTINPYYNSDTKILLISRLYPYILDSVGFPNTMADIAKRLEPDCEIKRSEDQHSHIIVTYNGESHYYGGAGVISGCGINEKDIVHPFIFDNSDDDVMSKITDISSVKDIFIDYFSYKETLTAPESLEFEEVCNIVGTEGGYVSIYEHYENGKIVPGYNYLHDSGIRGRGNDGLTCLSNAWFEGRYYNDYEYNDKGTTFEDSIENNKPDLVFKDYYCPLPDMGYDYKGHIRILYTDKTTKFDEIGFLKDHGYDSETGIWHGFMTFSFDYNSNSWKPSLFESYDTSEIKDFNDIYYWDENGDKHTINDLDSFNNFEITIEQAKDMQLDYNTNSDPKEYYIFDTTAEPGTYISVNE